MARTATRMVHIPLKSDNDIGLELSEGRVDVAFMTPQLSMPLAKAGKQKILAVLSVKPLPFLPELPALGDAGIAGLDSLDPFTFYGIVARAGTPVEIVTIVNQAVNAVLQSPEVATQMRDLFRVEPRPDTPRAFESFLRDELAKWTDIGSQIKLDVR
jgi:tripartite-type tricarboxylate transporter receptor subunit TctC